MQIMISMGTDCFAREVPEDLFRRSLVAFKLFRGNFTTIIDRYHLEQPLQFTTSFSSNTYASLEEAYEDLKQFSAWAI